MLCEKGIQTNESRIIIFFFTLCDNSRCSRCTQVCSVSYFAGAARDRKTCWWLCKLIATRCLRSGSDFKRQLLGSCLHSSYGSSRCCFSRTFCYQGDYYVAVLANACLCIAFCSCCFLQMQISNIDEVMLKCKLHCPFDHAECVIQQCFASCLICIRDGKLSECCSQNGLQNLTEWLE